MLALYAKLLHLQFTNTVLFLSSSVQGKIKELLIITIIKKLGIKTMEDLQLSLSVITLSSFVYELAFGQTIITIGTTFYGEINFFEIIRFLLTICIIF